jgi:hypothetical protein
MLQYNISNKNVTEDGAASVPLVYLPCIKDDNVIVHDNDVIVIDNESEHENVNENVIEN